MDKSSALDGSYDFVVVGGGSAGCVLASRLSEQASNRVVLIEAGPDLTHEVELAAISHPGMKTMFKPELLWSNFFVQASAAAEKDPERMLPMMQARLLGGGSSINGMHAQRGFPRDYDEWKSLGVEGWSWDDVLPYFVKLEADADFNGPMHGKQGPIAIRRMKREHWGPLSLAMEAKLKRDGLRAQTDLNTEFDDGVGPVPLNINSETRVSAARGYLSPTVRARPNLKILSNTEVDRIAFENRRAVGVDIRTTEGVRRIAATREVIVSCGALHSPTLLQRSGIGSGALLQEIGTAVLADRRGVGMNLSNHPMMSINAHVRRAGRPKSTEAPPCMAVLRYSSRVPNCPPTDMILNLWERVPSPLVHDPLGRQIADFMFILNKPFSLGDVRVNPADPTGRPLVRFNMLQDPRDLARMVGALRYGVSIMQSPAVKPLINLVFFMKPIPLLFAYLADTPKARTLSRAGGAVLGASDGIGASLLRRWTIPLDKLPDSDDELAQWVRAATLTSGHPTGTCRLGRADDPDAVVDSKGRVIGVEGARVTDASIFPTLMAAGTNLPTMMAAEKVAAHILRNDV